MTRVGEQADLLRALGRFLDEQKASGIDIKTHEVFLAVTWEKGEPGSQHKAYQEHDLEALRAHARALRRTSARGVSDGSYAELLRTLGQQLDEEGTEMNAIYEESDGFRVSGVGRGLYRTGLCFTSELIEWSVERRAARGTGPQEDDLADNPFERMSIGAAIFTRDNQRIGKVADIQGRYFKVDPGFLQRAYWLPAECVESAGSGEPALLSIPKAEVFEKRKTATPSTR